MSKNAYVTDAVWQLWLEVHAVIGYRVKLGGIYANKSGYHNTREANERHWPGNYSIQLYLDQLGPDDKAAAIDLTFSSETDMKRYTERLRAAMKARDPRMGSVKEFYGTLDGNTVYGLGKKSRTSAPYFTRADSSHLWHLHISFFRADVENWSRIKGVGEVLTNKNFSGGHATIPSGKGERMFPEYGDKSDAVEFYQRIFEYLGYELPRYGHDGDYGDETKNVVKAWFKDVSGKDYHGERITPWIAMELETYWHAKRLAPVFEGEKGDPGEPGPPGEDGKDATVTGTITVNLETGKVSA